MAANDALWDSGSGNARLALMRVGLPENREDVAALAAAAT